MPHSIKNLKIVRERYWDVLCECICLCKFISSPAKNDRKRTINTAFASWHIQLKNRVSDFWHMHLFFCGTRIKSEEANHQHFLWKNADYLKTEKEKKNPRHGFGGKLSDNKPAKFQLNRFRGCRLGVENMRLPFRNFRSEKTRKIYFLRHLTDLTRIRIITPNNLAITIGVWQVICSRPKLYVGRHESYYQRLVNSKLSLTYTDRENYKPLTLSRDRHRYLESQKRCTIYRKCAAFLHRKCKISLVQRSGFVLPMEHPSGTKYVNSPQLERFLDKKRLVNDSVVSVFSLPRSSQGCKWSCGNWLGVFGAWLLVRLLQPLLLVEVRALYYSPLGFQPNPSLTIFLTSSALPLQTKTDMILLFLWRHLNLSCGMYCVIKWHHYTLWFVSWQVTPGWQDLSTGN